MNANDSNDQEMERLLEEHFASGADNVPPPPNFWVLLEGRLGDQTPRPLWAGLRDWAFPYRVSVGRRRSRRRQQQWPSWE